MHYQVVALLWSIPCLAGACLGNAVSRCLSCLLEVVRLARGQAGILSLLLLFAGRYTLKHGLYRYYNPDIFDTDSRRKIDRRNIQFLKATGGWMGTDPKDRSRALYNGFYFLGGKSADSGHQCHLLLVLHTGFGVLIIL